MTKLNDTAGAAVKRSLGEDNLLRYFIKAPKAFAELAVTYCPDLPSFIDLTQNCDIRRLDSE